VEKTVNYIPKPKQQAFHKSKVEDCFFGGSKSPGKSCALTMESVIYACEHDGSTPHLFRKTYDDLEANLIQEFMRRVPQEAFTYDKTRHEAKLRNGSVVKFRFIGNLQDAYRYNGRSIPWIGVDELTEHEEEAIQILRSSNRSAEGFPVRFRATGNPGGIGHQWVKARYVDATNKGEHLADDKLTGGKIQFIPATVYDGVLVERDPTYVKRLENLPETERQAYLYGNWDIFEGAFFNEFGKHNEEQPFILPADCQASLFGSLDHGIGHPTSFGLWYLDSNNRLHRIFTYCQKGATTRDHAQSIRDAISLCNWTHGLFPTAIYFDPSMQAERRLNQEFFSSDIDEYKTAFSTLPASKSVEFTPASNRKPDGCHIMRGMFAPDQTAHPQMFYFAGLNNSFIDSIRLVQYDHNNREIYAKMDGDDSCDEARYGMVAGWTKINQRKTTPEVQPTAFSFGYRPVSDFTMFR
jgi:hypothetical protein